MLKYLFVPVWFVGAAIAAYDFIFRITRSGASMPVETAVGLMVAAAVGFYLFNTKED